MRSLSELIERVGVRKVRIASGVVLNLAVVAVGVGAGLSNRSDSQTAPAPVPSPGTLNATIAPSNDGEFFDDNELTFDSGARPVSTEVRLKTAGVLTACVDSPFPPFLYSKQSDGEDLSGIDVDLVTALATNNKLTPAFVETPFNKAFEALNAGTCDVIASAVTITDERKRTYEVSVSYFTVRQSILMGSGDSPFRSTADLRGKTVGVQTATPAVIAMKDDRISVTEFRGRADMLTALRDGAIDAIVADSSINGFDARLSGGDLVVSALLAGTDEQYGFLVAKDNPVLRSTLDESLTRLSNRGLLRKVVERYIDRAAVVD